DGLRTGSAGAARVKRPLSLTARLTLLYALVTTLLLVGMGVLAGVLVDRHFTELDSETLENKILLVQEVIAGPAGQGIVADRLDTVLQNHRGLYVQIRKGQKVLYTSAGTSAFNFGRLAAQGSGQSAAWKDAGQGYYGICRTDANRREVNICAVINTDTHRHFMHDIGRSLAVYILLSALLGGLLAWWGAYNALSPLRTMKARAQAITGQRLDAQMPVESVPLEMADLAESLNAMLSRLQADFRRLSAFSSDLAHELRTPISNLLTETQVAITQPRTRDEYRDILASNAEEFQRLARTVSDMLFLAKAENGLVLPGSEPMAVEEEVAALFEFYDALSEEQGIRFTLLGSGQVRGDRLMLRRALSNLLSNALRYADAGSVVHVQIRQQGGKVTISICNAGADIPAANLPRLFDRFFRGDPAREAGESDGAGLGLAITRSIVELHGGCIEVTSAGGQTCFILHFPAGDGVQGICPA
ncbi:heavy metal sensor histidine kinase, partial [Craterilacuibacter sp.]|uniref:heavy metal sensor histidine kinase n=1 Tax=Craterilacuibacter sp. TaxID=2870909 RepID=UPI003F334FD3